MSSLLGLQGMCDLNIIFSGLQMNKIADPLEIHKCQKMTLDNILWEAIADSQEENIFPEDLPLRGWKFETLWHSQYLFTGPGFRVDK